LEKFQVIPGKYKYNTRNQALWFEGSVCHCVTILTRNNRKEISKLR
jgi:hypothetical protein